MTEQSIINLIIKARNTYDTWSLSPILFGGRGQAYIAYLRLIDYCKQQRIKLPYNKKELKDIIKKVQSRGLLDRLGIHGLKRDVIYDWGTL